MKLTIKIITLLFVLFFVSCDDNTKEYIYQQDFVFKMISKENADTLLAQIQIEQTNNETIKYILEIPGNVFFKATINDSVIVENSRAIKKGNEKITIKNYSRNLSFYLKPELIKNNINIFIDNRVEGLFSKDLIKIYSIQKTKNSDKEEYLAQKSEELSFGQVSLPIIKINTYGNQISDTNKIIAEYFVYNGEDKISLQNKPILNGKLKIKIRGSSSKLFPKQSYSIKTFNDSLKKESVELLGLPKENDWVLYAPYLDLSLMRNALSYNIYRNMGHYSPRTKYCHLIINNNYRGIYVLTESIKVDKNRVNIKKLNPDSKDISGGYIVKLDKGKGRVWRSPYNSQIDTGFGKWFFYVYPKKKKLTEKQAQYIKEYISNFEKAIVEKQDWKQYIDINSFIDYQILMELAKNVDAYRLSMFFTKDMAGKLKIEPIWDMNLTFGLSSYYDGYKTDGLMYKDKATPFWWTYFLDDEEYKNQFINRWQELRKSLFSISSLNELINMNKELLQDDIRYNALKWNSFNEKNNWRKYNPKNYNKSIDYIKSWTKKRVEYLDKEFSKL